MNRLKIRAMRPSHFMNMAFIEIYGTTPDGRYVVSGTSITELKENEAIVVDPMALLSRADAQGLIDDLWNCGLRPAEGSGSEGSLAATQRHLADMRTIVGSKLNIELK